MDKLTLQEEEVMRAIWALGTCVIRQIVDQYPEPRPPYTSIAYIVENLKSKGYLVATKCGKTYEYTPLIAEHEYKRTFLGEFVQDFFGNSYEKLVAFFANEQKISSDELKNILREIDKGDKNG